MNRRVRTDFTNAFNSTGQALENIAVLGLSVSILCIFGVLLTLRKTRNWLRRESVWMVPGRMSE